jgi:hypothetical protein
VALGDTGAMNLTTTLIIALALACAQPAYANDRPLQSARTAMAEDDDQVWSLETWVQRYGKVRGLSFEPEYTFSPHFSVQAELTRLIDGDGVDTGRAAELELKYLFNNIAVDGYGWGLSATLAAERTRGAGSTTRSLTLKIPVSIELGQRGGFVHLNAGVVKDSDAPLARVRSLAFEREVFRRTTAFVELARDADLRFAQVGVRHWIKREKIAIDFALQRQGTGAPRASGFIFGLGFYDL